MRQCTREKVGPSTVLQSLSNSFGADCGWRGSNILRLHCIDPGDAVTVRVATPAFVRTSFEFQLRSVVIAAKIQMRFDYWYSI